MNQDEIGMQTDKVKSICNKLVYAVSNGKKIENELNSLKDKASGIYSSNNSVILDSNNNFIIEGIHVNTKNIESYNLFINKQISEYDKINNNSLDILNSIYNSTKK